MTFNPDNPQEHKEYNKKLEEFNKLPVIERLKRIADKQNNNKLNFKDTRQTKYYLAYDYNTNFIMQLTNCSMIKDQGTIYCINKNFKEIVLKCIKKEELEKYLKE